MYFQIPTLETGNSWWTCRDILVSDIRGDQVKANKLNEPNWEIIFGQRIKIDNLWQTYQVALGAMDYMRVLWQGVARETNSKFPPTISPFTLRWLIAKGRHFAKLSEEDQALRMSQLPDLSDQAACNRYAGRFAKDWFAALMRQANDNMIKLNPNIKEAWRVGIGINLWQDPMGLTQLKNAPISYKQNFNWFEAFPPSRLMAGWPSETDS